MYKKLFSLTAIMLLVLACNTDDAEQVDLNEIRLYTTISSLTRAANVAADLQDTQFKANTEISVKVTDTNTDSSQPTTTYSLTTFKADGSGNLSILSGGTPLYYPPTGSSVNVYAYHPRGAAENFSIQTDQSGTNEYVASDLMWGQLAAPITKTSTADDRKLQFEHLFSKIIVKLVKGTGVEDAEVNAATITFGPVIYKGTFTASSGAFLNAADADENKSNITIATNAGTSEHAAIIIPQDVSGKSLSISMGGGTQSYTIPASTTYEKGKKYTYTVTVNKSGLIVTTQITDWQTPTGYIDPTPSITF